MNTTKTTNTTHGNYATDTTYTYLHLPIPTYSNVILRILRTLALQHVLRILQYYLYLLPKQSTPPFLPVLPLLTCTCQYLPILTILTNTYMYLPILTNTYLYLPILTCTYLFLPILTFIYLPILPCPRLRQCSTSARAIVTFWVAGLQRVANAIREQRSSRLQPCKTQSLRRSSAPISIPWPRQMILMPWESS